MKRKTLVDTVADHLLDRIISGEIPVGSLLPAEMEIAAAAGVSRLTVREAVKALRAKNIVVVRRGSGTQVNPPEQWTSLEDILRATSYGRSPASTSLQLLELRNLIEAGAVALAVRRRTDEDLAELEEALLDMAAAAADGDGQAFAAAQGGFRHVVLRASGNLLVSALNEPVESLLTSVRGPVQPGRDEQHRMLAAGRALLEALKCGDADRAGRALAARRG